MILFSKKRFSIFLLTLILIILSFISYTQNNNNNDNIKNHTFALEDDSFIDVKNKLDVCILEFDQTSYLGDMDSFEKKFHKLKAKYMPFLPNIYFQFKRKTNEGKYETYIYSLDEDKNDQETGENIKLLEVIIQFDKRNFTYEKLYAHLQESFGDSDIIKPKKAIWNESLSKNAPGAMSIYLLYGSKTNHFKPEIWILSSKGKNIDSNKIQKRLEKKYQKKYKEKPTQINLLMHIKYSNKDATRMMLTGGWNNNPYNPTLRIINTHIIKNK